MAELNAKNQIIAVTQALLERTGFSGQVSVVEDQAGSLPIVTIASNHDLSMLIGKNGQNLSAFEHLVRLIVYRQNQGEAEAGRGGFVVDVNNYRRSRSRHLVEIAKSAAQRVISTQRAEALAPMTAFERRLVHTELAAYKELQTESIGAEPSRRIVVKPLVLE